MPSTQPWEEVKSCEYINEDSLKEKFGEFLEKHYPQSLWGIINFFPIQDFIKELLSSERAKLLKEIEEKIDESPLCLRDYNRIKSLLISLK